MNNDSTSKNGLQKTLDTLTATKGTPISAYFLLLLLATLAIYMVSQAARSQAAVPVLGMNFPVSILTGVFSSLANLCLILMVVLFHKLGFVSAIIFLSIQFPRMLMGIIMHQAYTGVAGIFSGVFTIITILILFANDRKIDKYQSTLKEHAVIDTLTGLPNRVACIEILQKLVSKKEKFTLVFIDLNNFKSINDIMGHSLGNKVLIEIANRWKRLANEVITGTKDFITRQGGDEFALIIRDYESEEQVLNTISRYEKELEKKIVIDEFEFFVTSSFGYAEFPTDTDKAGTLISYADAAMYDVKRAGGNTHIRRFTHDLMDEVERTTNIERKIRKALEDNTFYFNVQPQFDINHKLRGFEALARMKDFEGYIVSPADFIPVAEKTGLIDKVDMCVFRQAAGFFAEYIKENNNSEVLLSINISVKHLLKEGFIEEISEVINQNHIPFKQIEMEITESIMIDSEDKALKVIEQVKDLGINIAIDDFGTGYSSLSYLNQIPANLLKIDKAFIDKMNTSESSKQYVATIISIGHLMNFEVISEGVEEEDQLATLKEIGCDLIQGYIWGKPVMPDVAKRIV